MATLVALAGAAVAGSIGVAWSGWVVRLPQLAVIVLVCSLVSGQLVRFALPGQGGGVLPSDGAVLLVIAAAALQGMFGSAALGRAARLSLILFVPFITWSLFSLGLNSWRYDGGQTSIAMAYWLRLSAYLLLVPALLVLLRQPGSRQLAHAFLVSVFVAISAIGLAQLWVLPDLGVVSGGWDPHVGRLVSTWLDPNFLGVFLSLGICSIAAVPGAKRHPLLWGALIVVVLALLFTQSRSSYLALGISFLALSPLLIIARPRKIAVSSKVRLSIVVCMAAVVVVAGVMLLGERAVGLLVADETVSLRAEALTVVWQLAAEHSLLGVGYNAYQFAALESGLIGDFSIHSRAGADNSVLTLWVTTGFIGVVLFFTPWLVFGAMLVRRWLQHGSVLAFSGALSIVTVFVHAQFVNSFLYVHVLITLALVVSLALADAYDDHKYC